jgi:hypothetical protein
MKQNNQRMKKATKRSTHSNICDIAVFPVRSIVRPTSAGSAPKRNNIETNSQPCETIFSLEK